MKILGGQTAATPEQLAGLGVAVACRATEVPRPLFLVALMSPAAGPALALRLQLSVAGGAVGPVLIGVALMGQFSGR